MSVRRTLRHFDYALAAAVILLAVFGVLMIYQATHTGATSWLRHLYGNQRLYLITGVGLMLFFALVDYRFIMRFYIAIYVLCIILLVLVLFIGRDSGTVAARWLWIPIPGRSAETVSIQPSEFTKIFIILFLARLLERWKDRFNHVLFLGLILLIVALPVALILFQPSLSASMVAAAAALSVLFAGGLYYRTILAGVLLVIPAGVVLWLDVNRTNPLIITRLLKSYQWERIETYLRPVVGSEEYRQMQGSLYAIATGGLYGKGFGNNTYVINGHNDFVFSVAAEQFGFVGCAAVLGVMAFVIVRCILIAQRAFDIQGRLIAAGVAGMLLFETFVNVSAITELLPNTGMPFPFLSYGGSSMWVHMIAAGLVINIGIPREKSMFESDEPLGVYV